MPVVTTLHTVLSQPSRVQRAVIDRIVAVSSRVVVMAEKGRELLQKVYDVPADKIEVIPHGIPDIAFAEPEEAKARFGFTGKAVILTFGLLSPNKGIEYVIDAMPAILRSRPDAVYVVLGATHPNLVREKGEAYREGLVARAAKLGVSDHVVFLDQFVDQTTLLGFISMCDVYVTPYLNAGADDVRHAGLQLRPRQGGGLDTVLARSRTSGGWPRSPRALRRRTGRLEQRLLNS